MATERRMGVGASAYHYFRVDLDYQLSVGEIKRRRAIKERLESQFEQWQSREQHLWRAIPHSTTVSFLDIDWSQILPIVKNHFKSQCVAFALLSELQLCTILASVADSYQFGSRTSPDLWLYEQYRRYAIRIQDFGNHIEQYYIPLIEATVTPSRDPDSPFLFEESHPSVVSRMLPPQLTFPSTFRLVIFPQTRYSFIEDKKFRSLYPLPEEQVTIMSHKLLKRFQGNSGYYNALPSPFTDSITQKSYDGREFRFLAAMYPIIEFEFVADYENRKRSEIFVTSVQQQSHKGFPSVAQWRYSRRFDFAEESQFRGEISQSDDCPERIQSGRALYEYAYGDLETLSLDLQQISLLEEVKSKVTGEKYLLVVEPLWLIVFPESDTICAFRNEKIDDPFKEIWSERIDSEDWGQVLIQLVNKADKCMGSYERTYRKRLAKLQSRIHSYGTSDYPLIKSLSNFVAELTILLDPLQAQINALRRWQQCQRADWPAKSQWTDGLFEDAIKVRQDHLDSLKRLQERARESQTLLFQLNNTETANLQSQLAMRMEQETKVQVDLAKKTEHQNKSILIFTIITIIFLPLSFFTSYFGMTTSDIRYWSIATPISITVIASAILIAFRATLEEKIQCFHCLSKDKKALLSTME